MKIEENLYEFEEEEISVEEELNDLAADLVSFKRYSTFLERLFSQNDGKWHKLEVLCSGIKDIEQRFIDWRDAGSLVESVQVAWLDYPNESLQRQYCVIIFFCENPHWITDAIYNKRRFLKDLYSSDKLHSFATLASTHANRTQTAQVSAD